MSLSKEIKDILFEIGKEITIHQIDEDNAIIEIDYDKYTTAILKLFEKNQGGIKGIILGSIPDED